MPRELRVSVTLKLPDGVLLEAIKIAEAGPHIEALTESLSAVGDATVTYEVVSPKGRGADAKPRKPRAKVEAVADHHVAKAA